MVSVTSKLREKIVEGYVGEGMIPDVPVYMPRDKAWAQQNTRGPVARLRITVIIEQLEDDNGP